MDLVSDLTSQCVTYITVAKEVYKQQLVSGANKLTPLSGTVGELANGFTVNTNKLSLNLKVRVWELIFISKEHKYIFNKERPKKHFGPNLDMDSIALVQENTLKVFFNTCYQLISWVYKNKENAESLPDLYSTAYEWRSCVRSILYKNSSERLKLVEILEYMPVQVIFCLGASQTPENSDLLRLYQVWDPKVNLHSISEADKKT